MFSWLRRAYIPLFTQITAPFILLALVIAAGGTYIVTRLVFDSLEERFTNQLIETGILAEQSLVRTETDLLEALRVISNTQGMDFAVLAGEVETVANLVLPGAYNTSIGAVIIVNRAGRPLLSVYLNPGTQAYEVLDVSAPYASLAPVQKVLSVSLDTAGDKFAGIVPSGQGDFFFIAGPIRQAGGTLAGAALVGISVKDLALRARAETLAQLSFYTPEGHILSSTFVSPQDIDPTIAAEVLARQIDSSFTRNLLDSGISYNEIVSAWEVRGGEDLGLVGVGLPPTILVQASQFTRQNTLLWLGATLLLVVLVGLFVANQVARPIRALKEAALQVGLGNLRVKVAQRGSNELSVLTGSFNDMVSSLSASNQNLLDAYTKTIEGWARATDLRDHETHGHSRRVADLSVALAKSMGIKDDELIHLYRGALLHDIGKIAIPDSILHKKGTLSLFEREQMKGHPAIAKGFMEGVKFLEPALAIPFAHHEKWDGTGYPRGLKGEQIPLAARIFAVVDVWDAMTSDRPYREAQDFDDTIKQIEGESGKHFDPVVVQAFMKLLGR